MIQLHALLIWLFSALALCGSALALPDSESVKTYPFTEYHTSFAPELVGSRVPRMFAPPLNQWPAEPTGLAFTDNYIDNAESETCDSGGVGTWPGSISLRSPMLPFGLMSLLSNRASCKSGKVANQILPPGYRAPELTVQTELRNGVRLRPEDQFTVRLLHGQRTVGSVTSRGTGATIWGGVLGPVTLRAGRSYRLGQVMAAGSTSTLAQYETKLVCINHGRGGTSMQRVTNLGDSFIAQGGDRIYCKVRNSPRQPRLTLQVRSLGEAATFSFKANSHAMPLNQLNGYEVTTSAGGTTADGRTVSLERTLVQLEIAQLPQRGWDVLSASCFDRNAAVTGNSPGDIGRRVGNTLVIDAPNVRAASDLHCTFISGHTGSDIEGRVIIDNGVDGGTAHDGVQNGGEFGQAGVRVELTDCAGRVYGQMLTQSNGAFNFSTTDIASGQLLCVRQLPPSGYRAVSGNAGNSREARSDDATHLQFFYTSTWKVRRLLFGNAPVSTLTTGSAKTIASGTAITHAHIYTAGSAGKVEFRVEDHGVATAVQATRSLHWDPGCDGVLGVQFTAYTAPILVAAGQTVCVLVKVFVPTDAEVGGSYQTRLLVDETWQVPTLLERQQRHVLQSEDISTVLASGLTLLKEWRRVDVCPASADASRANTVRFGTTGQARPGALLEYRLTYSNHTPSPLSGITIHDAVVAYTVFEQALCLEYPAPGIAACRVAVRPRHGAVNGAIAWELEDAGGLVRGLQPQQSGAVGFCLRVQP